jgi:RNA polymerase sigma-70 factor (ECF subfamily)
LHPTDRELVAQIVRRSDEDAFRVLFRRFTPRLFALARRLLAGDEADADDVVQEAWVRAAGRLGEFGWRSSLSTWLSGFVINCARERLRRRRPDAADPETLEALPGPVGIAGLALDLDAAIARLPDGYRTVLVLHDVEGYTHDEIATLVGIAPGTSKSQLFQARRAIRRALAPVSPEARDHAG